MFCLLMGCQTNEANFPELLTRDAQQVGATSAVLEAEIKVIGPVRPISFGFLWGVQQDITIASAANKVVAGTASEPRTYSIKLDNLSPGTTYYYKSFALHNSPLVQNGNIVYKPHDIFILQMFCYML